MKSSLFDHYASDSPYVSNLKGRANEIIGELSEIIEKANIQVDNNECEDDINWQDIMIEHCTNSDWVNEAIQNGLEYCGRLCETIIKERDNAKKLKLKSSNVDIKEKVLTGALIKLRSLDNSHLSPEAFSIVDFALKRIGEYDQN